MFSLSSFAQVSVGSSSRQSPNPRPSASTATREDRALYNCIDSSQWTGGNNNSNEYADHNLEQCNQEWALRNSNEANILTEAYLLELEKRIKTAKQNNDTAALDRLKSEKVCDQNATMDDCENMIKRRVVSHTTQIRETTAKTNRLLVEIDEKDGPQANAPANRGRRILEVVDTQRRANTQNQNQAQQMRPCSENPFVPCTVNFTRNNNSNNQNQAPATADQATTDFSQGRVNISSITRGQVITGSSTLNVEMSVPNQQNQTLQQAMQQRLNDTNTSNIFRRSEYESDARLQQAQAEQQQQNIQQQLQQSQSGQYSETRANSGESWGAFNNALDRLVTQRQQTSRSANDIVDFYFAIEGGRSPSGNGNGGGISTDGIIRSRMNIPTPQ